MRVNHTPLTAAQAVRGLLAGSIATTWEKCFDGNNSANAYNATKLIQEQCNGPGKSHPISFQQAGEAVSQVMPELFVEYWQEPLLRQA
jgi:hypothetical protein